MKVQLFITCLGEHFYPGTLEKMVAILERLGVEMTFAEDQTCYGQPFLNSGFEHEARHSAYQWQKIWPGERLSSPNSWYIS